MKKIILSLLVCIVTLTSYGQKTKAKTKAPAKTQAKTALSTYNNVDHKIKFQYPQDWELTDTVSDAIVYLFTPTNGDDDRFSENLNLSFEDISSSGITFKDYVDQNVASIKDGVTITDLKQTSAKFFKWNGLQAYEIIYSGNLEGVDFRLSWIQRFFLRDGKIYLITYSADGDKKDPYVTSAKQLINSIKFY
ncbi:PsbP-related protein [Ferruginibacter sp. SUN002]|uniref:PsbP-related protein n=1 Tax=Ferruginibacter sp. SUN002 TaxID=2937789 RepID=UPI003D36F376